jgi:tetratricopeptide (TPR) repeat protein
VASRPNKFGYRRRSPFLLLAHITQSELDDIDGFVDLAREARKSQKERLDRLAAQIASDDDWLVDDFAQLDDFAVLSAEFAIIGLWRCVELYRKRAIRTAKAMLGEAAAARVRELSRSRRIRCATTVNELRCLNDADKAFQDHYARGNYSAAQIEAQKLERMAKARFGGDHPYYAVALNRLGIVVQAQGKYTEAEELYKRALVIREKALPSAWPRPVRGASPPPRPSPPTSNALAPPPEPPTLRARRARAQGPPAARRIQVPARLECPLQAAGHVSHSSPRTTSRCNTCINGTAPRSSKSSRTDSQSILAMRRNT